jgi:hypothetical protein
MANTVDHDTAHFQAKLLGTLLDFYLDLHHSLKKGQEEGS